MRPALPRSLLPVLILIVAGVVGSLASSGRAAAEAADAPAATAADRLSALRAAFSRAPRADDAELRLLQLALGEDPLWPWIEYRHLSRHPARLSRERALAFLARHGEQPAGRALRRSALQQFAERGDWASFAALDAPELSASDPTLRCHSLAAGFALGKSDTRIDAALDEWRHGRPLPNACDPVIAALDRLGKLDSARVLERIEAAAGHGESALMRHLARRLPAHLRAQVGAEAGFIEAPSASAADWPAHPRGRAAIESGLAALARREPGQAEVLLDRLAAAQDLELERVGRLRRAIALWSAASYLPEAADRLARVPEAAYDAQLHEWRVREALARRDARAALAALEAMPEAQRLQARWSLVQARLQAQLGQLAEARRHLQRAAVESNFHGFAAADLLDQDYRLCPLEPPASAAARVDALPGLQRALDLFELGYPGWAAQEWQAAMAPLSLDERARAVELAVARGWYERAASTLGEGEGLRYYRQRFPLPHAASLARESRRHDLPMHWVAGLIRAESSWTTRARSAADARGLMQLLPATGRDTARRLGRSWPGPQGLYNAELNLALGTAYLRQMLEAHGGKPALATAAYNAGPAAVGRWLRQRPQSAPLLDDPLLWLETMPFHETRDYVARVMAFSLFYDWREHGRAPSLLDRLQGRPERRPRGFRCTPAAS